MKVATGLDLPLQAVTETFAILAVRRAGKSNTAVVIAEQMHAAGLPWVAVDPKGDWWGVRSSASGHGPGLAVVVFGGLHGDLPLEPGAGAYIADLVAARRLTCVLDTSEMSKGEQIRFLVAFAERLLKVNREPLHLFLEEADEYIPQRVESDMARVVGAVGKLAARWLPGYRHYDHLPALRRCEQGRVVAGGEPDRPSYDLAAGPQGDLGLGEGQGRGSRRDAGLPAFARQR